jgi:hypothetical protein
VPFIRYCRKYGKAREATEENIIRCMRIASWITKATEVHIYRHIPRLVRVTISRLHFFCLEIYSRGHRNLQFVVNCNIARSGTKDDSTTHLVGQMATLVVLVFSFVPIVARLKE